jgi:hypothetical protein
VGLFSPIFRNWDTWSNAPITPSSLRSSSFNYVPSLRSLMYLRWNWGSFRCSPTNIYTGLGVGYKNYTRQPCIHKSAMDNSSKIWCTLEHARWKNLHALASNHFVRQPGFTTPFGAAIMMLTFLPHAKSHYQPIQESRYDSPCINIVWLQHFGSGRAEKADSRKCGRYC